MPEVFRGTPEAISAFFSLLDLTIREQAEEDARKALEPSATAPQPATADDPDADTSPPRKRGARKPRKDAP